MLAGRYLQTEGFADRGGFMEYLQCREMSCVERYRGQSWVEAWRRGEGGEISRSLEDALSVTCAGALTGSHVAIDTWAMAAIIIIAAATPSSRRSHWQRNTFPGALTDRKRPSREHCLAENPPLLWVCNHDSEANAWLCMHQWTPFLNSEV